MITNNGKLHCNDCGQKLDKLHGLTLGVALDGQHFCLRHYRNHFGPDELEALDREHVEGFKTILGIPTGRGCQESDYPYIAKPPKFLASS